jgi:SAM-dependent methyltransferase
MMAEQPRRPIPADAAAYERHGAPRGAPFTRPLLALAPPWPGARVLDVACGTGVVARAVASIAAADGLVVAVDRSPAMAAATRIRAAEESAPRLYATVMDAHALALADQSFDLVYCQFGLMLMAEPPRAAAELARVVRPGGVVAAVVWSAPAAVVGFSAYFAAAHATVPGALAPERHPVFSLSAPGALNTLLAAAGLHVEREEPVVLEDTLPDQTSYWAWVSEVLGFPVAIGGRPEMRRVVDYPAAVQAAARQDALARLAPYVQPDGRLALPSEAVLTVARR